ncbi:hypothetical protein [Tardibacter chloracetimidivorans]|uniref:hypothetical protein n=1 Tax=Tardibacter chloracetimidivorans TaxID=1921510 RepID=UPI001D055170|nr:hypothetical protein [Tardibacter chloracetimidivorans]
MRFQTPLRILVTAGALVATLPLALSAADAQPRPKKKPPVTLSTAAPGTLGFTPSVADPKLAATLSRGTGEEKMFRFTPAGSPGSKKSVTVALRSRGVSKAEAAKTMVAGTEAIAPSAYNLGVSIGWSRFALSGGIAKVDAGLAPFGRESVDVGVSYLGRNWSGTLQLGADHENDEAAPAIGRERSYSVDLGGAYSVSRNLSLSGGVRLKRDEAEGLTFDGRRDSQAVYVGTSFSF